MFGYGSCTNHQACFNISKVSLPVLPNLTQNLMHTLCSSTSTIPPISENRRRLMQYTHKDTCNNQTFPHPTTPLGTLTHKTPTQHTLVGNSWTTSDLRVMSIVLRLLDTPSYKKRPRDIPETHTQNNKQIKLHDYWLNPPPAQNTNIFDELTGDDQNEGREKATNK